MNHKLRTYKKSKVSEFDEDYQMEGFLSDKSRVFSQPIATAPMLHKIYLPYAIGYSELFHEEFEVLDNASDADVVIFDINCIGGSLDTALVFTTKIKNTLATTYAMITGKCASAATMIALACDSIEIADNCTFLIHQPTGGFFGPFQEAHGQSDHYREMIEDYYKSTYEGFLSTAEIEDVLKGQSIWLSSKQVRDRIEQRIKYFEEREDVIEE